MSGFTRNEEGSVVMETERGVVTAIVPSDRSALGLIAINGLIHNGRYSNDGWVYLNDIPVRKWHIKFDDIRVWEPKMNKDNLIYLHSLWKRTNDAQTLAWDDTIKVIKEIWSPKMEDEKAIAHVKPLHHLRLPSNQKYFGKKDTWWEFSISNYEGRGTPAIGWNWIDDKPKDLKLKNLSQGERLYQLDLRRESLNKRAWRARVIFYETMRRALPDPTERAILNYKFGNDSFVFHTLSRGPHCHWWVMFDDRYKMEVKEMI